MRKLIMMIGVLLMSAMGSVTAQDTSNLDPENTLHLYLKDGMVVIKMFPDQAPNHVRQIKELVREGYYDNKLWHRVISGFMAQTGSPDGTGVGGSNKPNLNAEFNSMSHV